MSSSRYFALQTIDVVNMMSVLVVVTISLGWVWAETISERHAKMGKMKSVLVVVVVNIGVWFGQR